MEQIDNIEPKKKIKKKPSTSTKVLLSRENFGKATAWQTQVNQIFHGMIKTNRAELINLVLETLPNELTPKLIKQIQDQKLDDVTKAKWVYLKLQDAQKNGENLRLEDLIKEVNMTNKKPSRRTKTKNPTSENQKNKVDEIENNQN